MKTMANAVRGLGTYFCMLIVDGRYHTVASLLELPTTPAAQADVSEVK